MPDIFAGTGPFYTAGGQRAYPMSFPNYGGQTLQPSPYGWQNPQTPGVTYDPTGRMNLIDVPDPITSGQAGATGSLVGGTDPNDPFYGGPAVDAYLQQKYGGKLASMGVTTPQSTPVNTTPPNLSPQATVGGPVMMGGNYIFNPFATGTPDLTNLPNYGPQGLTPPPTTNNTPTTNTGGNTINYYTGGTTAPGTGSDYGSNAFQQLMAYLAMQQGDQQGTNQQNAGDWWNTAFANP